MFLWKEGRRVTWTKQLLKEQRGYLVGEIGRNLVGGKNQSGLVRVVGEETVPTGEGCQVTSDLRGET